MLLDDRGRALIARQDWALRDKVVYPVWRLHLHHRCYNSNASTDVALGRRHGTTSPPSDFPFNCCFWNATRHAHCSTPSRNRSTVCWLAIYLLDIVWFAIPHLDPALPLHARLSCHQPWRDHMEEISVSFMGHPEACIQASSHHPSVLDWILHFILFHKLLDYSYIPPCWSHLWF